MSYYLAIDAGGTKTDFLLADEHSELARVRTGTIKRMRVDAPTATAHLEQALAALSAQAGVFMQDVVRTCIGTAGESVPLVVDWLRTELGTRVGGELILLGDVEIALDAAFNGGQGVLVLAGTGSNVAGRDASGRVTSAGGWGPALADRGSGHRIGHEALRALFASIDAGTPSALLTGVLAAWHLTTIDQLVEMANRIPSPDFSRLTPLVLRCAQEGDAVASRVLQSEGEALAELASIVIRRLQMAGDRSWVPEIAFAGSILGHVFPIREVLIATISREFAGAHAIGGVVDPVRGALWRARGGRSAGARCPARSV